MNKSFIVISLCLVPLLQGCDVRNPTNKPNTETRTMIIGGMPVHDRDFKLEQAPMLAANVVESPNSTVSP